MIHKPQIWQDGESTYSSLIKYFFFSWNIQYLIVFFNKDYM